MMGLSVELREESCEGFVGVGVLEPQFDFYFCWAGEIVGGAI